MMAQAERLLKDGSKTSSALLPALFAIFNLWRLDDAHQMALLGLRNKTTLYKWKHKPEQARLTKNLLERASYILGIYKALQILLPDQKLADQWLTTPNDNPLFNGRVPLDRLLTGQVADLALIRNFLDAERVD